MEHATSMSSHSASSEVSSKREADSSGISWRAILGGAAVTAALSLTMLALGAGFGLSSVSPWSGAGLSASVVGTSVIIWLVVIQIVGSGMGGYIAGRLRTKWTAIHSDEVYFRDTAHGFLAWAVAVVTTGAFLGSAATAMVGGAAKNVEIAGPANAYYVDALFRSTANQSAANVGDALRDESARILFSILGKGDAAAGDQAYLAQLVSSKTGLNQNDAGERVAKVVKRAQEAADTTRKATARLLLWTFLALLIGALSASYAATIGGRQRDHVKAM